MTPEQLKTRCEEIRSILDSGNQNRIDANRQKIADFAYEAAEEIQKMIAVIQYAIDATEHVVRTGRTAEGGEQNGNWIHLVEARKALVEIIK